MTNTTQLEALMQSDVLDAHLGRGLQRQLVERILSQPDVAAASAQKLAAGGTLLQILAALLPFVLQFLSSGTINWAAIIAAIEAIITPSAN